MKLAEAFSCKNVGLAIFLLFTPVAAIFDLFAVPIPIWENSGTEVCMSMWGQKNNCLSTSYDVYTSDLNYCDAQKQMMYIAFASQIASILLSIAAFILGVIMAYQSSEKFWFPTVLVSWLAFLTIFWPFVASVILSRTDICNMGPLKDRGWVFTSGFGLGIIAWIFELAAVSLFMLLPSDIEGKDKVEDV
jgi:ABC-type glycerol-3-phosphate transport system permease component